VPRFRNPHIFFTGKKTPSADCSAEGVFRCEKKHVKFHPYEGFRCNLLWQDDILNALRKSTEILELLSAFFLFYSAGIKVSTDIGNHT
jgi:hypothetical protein